MARWRTLMSWRAGGSCLSSESPDEMLRFLMGGDWRFVETGRFWLVAGDDVFVRKGFYARNGQAWARV